MKDYYAIFKQLEDCFDTDTNYKVMKKVIEKIENVRQAPLKSNLPIILATSLRRVISHLAKDLVKTTFNLLTCMVVLYHSCACIV